MASAYTPTQIEQWETYVSLPAQYRLVAKHALNPTYLTALHIHQIAAIPYENLILHYSSHHSVSLEPQFLFQKMVGDKRGRGGYCMENSIFFHHVLKALGFSVYMAGVRIRPRVGGTPGGEYIGWVHIVNIVTLPDGTKWMLDVGFGGDGPTKPLPLVSERVSQNLGSQEVRLIRGPLPHSSQQDQLHWIYQYRNSTTQPWNSFYAFPELEFFARDFEIMSHYTSTSFNDVNFQTVRVLIVRFLKGALSTEDAERLREETGYDGEGIVGKVMLVDGEVKTNHGGKTKVVRVCENEVERVRAIEEEFGMNLTQDEAEGVKGRIVELKGKETKLERHIVSV